MGVEASERHCAPRIRIEPFKRRYSQAGFNLRAIYEHPRKVFYLIISGVVPELESNQ